MEVIVGPAMDVDCSRVGSVYLQPNNLDAWLVIITKDSNEVRSEVPRECRAVVQGHRRSSMTRLL